MADGSGLNDILAAAASATQQQMPEKPGSLTTFGPTPLVQPPSLPKVQMPPIQFGQAGNEFQTVGGRQRADRQALISNIANVVKSGGDYIQAKKQRDLSMKIERLMGAMEGLNEAKAEGNQEGIARNSAIINDITADPKTSKQLQKAFNIDLFGTGKNKQENQALMEAWKNFQANKQKDPNTLNPTAQRLMQSQPWRQQLSPEAQAQAMAIKAGLIPKAGEILSAAQENFKALLQAKTSEDRTAALDKIAQDRIKATMYHADKIYDAMMQRNLNAMDIARIRFTTEQYKADTMAKIWDKRLSMMKDVAEIKKEGSPFNNLYKEANTYNQQIKQLVQDNQKMQAELDKPSSSTLGKIFGMKAPDSAQAKQMKFNIQMNLLKIKQAESQRDDVLKKMQMLDTVSSGGLSGLMQGDQNTTGGSGEDSGGVIDVPDSEMQEPQ